MMDTYERLKSKLVFDPLDFDQELIELPMLILEATEETTLRLADRDRCKNDLDLATAQVAHELRSAATTDVKGQTKQRSEAQIESELALYEPIQQSQAKLEKAKHELAIWQALCDAFRTKRDAIKVFAELTISGYLSPNQALDNRKAEMRAASNSSSRRRQINAA